MDWSDRIQWSGIPKRPWGCKRGWLPSVVVEGDGRVTVRANMVTCYWPSRENQTPIGMGWLDRLAERSDSERQPETAHAREETNTQ